MKVRGITIFAGLPKLRQYHLFMKKCQEKGITVVILHSLGDEDGILEVPIKEVPGIGRNASGEHGISYPSISAEYPATKRSNQWRHRQERSSGRLASQNGT